MICDITRYQSMELAEAVGDYIDAMPEATWWDLAQKVVALPILCVIFTLAMFLDLCLTGIKMIVVCGEEAKTPSMNQDLLQPWHDMPKHLTPNQAKLAFLAHIIKIHLKPLSPFSQKTFLIKMERGEPNTIRICALSQMFVVCATVPSQVVANTITHYNDLKQRTVHVQEIWFEHWTHIHRNPYLHNTAFNQFFENKTNEVINDPNFNFALNCKNIATQLLNSLTF